MSQGVEREQANNGRQRQIFDEFHGLFGEWNDRAIC